MTVDQIKEVLRQGIVSFRYTKKDGTIREAKGTLNMDVITEAGSKPRGGECIPKRVGYVPYYDVEKEAWRCFEPEQFELVSGEVANASAE